VWSRQVKLQISLAVEGPDWHKRWDQFMILGGILWDSERKCREIKAIRKAREEKSERIFLWDPCRLPCLVALRHRDLARWIGATKGRGASKVGFYVPTYEVEKGSLYLPDYILAKAVCWHPELYTLPRLTMNLYWNYQVNFKVIKSKCLTACDIFKNYMIYIVFSTVE
jgi:hypothetical protein